MKITNQVKAVLGIAVLGAILIVAFYGWKVGAAAIGSLLAIFGIGKKPVQKVKEKVEKEMVKLDNDPDPNAHALNIANQLRKRRARKNRRRDL